MDSSRRRFHIALAVRDLAESIADYTRRLGVAPTAVVTGKYAMWRTEQMNFSINESAEDTGMLRHLGFEDETAVGFTTEQDPNGIVWELFSPAEQDEAIRKMYGVPVGT
jgi:catechol 2,3-dioxygenase-like lactoylglutathione lyase family enzyme